MAKPWEKFNTKIKQHFSEPYWLMIENKWDKQKQDFYESLFTIGNGRMGSRAVLEEIPAGSYASTLFAGVYDSVGAQVTELVNAPNPINFRIIAEGEKLGVDTMDIREHVRVFDIYQGLLARRTLYQSTNSGRLDYQSVRFLSMADVGIGVLQVYLTPLDQSVNISCGSSIDISVMNKGLLTEGSKKHFHVSELSKKGSVNFVCVKTFDKDIDIAYASCLKSSIGNNEKSVRDRVFKIRLQKNRTVCLTKYFSCSTSVDIRPKKLRSHVIDLVKKACKKKVSGLVFDNKKAWALKWNISDIRIKGDLAVQQALRLNIYHLLICGSDDKGFSSIGARTLSGEGYRGHVFWDTEIFLLPFYANNYPQIARSLLLYRYNRINAAKDLAKEKGYEGTLYPWESADDGKEVTPTWVKNSEGDIIKIATSLREHHLVADIAYSVRQYVRITNDIDFLLDYGLEMMLAASKFWISRLEYNKKQQCYDINHIIGPDEFHEDVNNNAFTNCMAKWTILRTLQYVDSMKSEYSGKIQVLLIKWDLSPGKLKKWGKIVSKISKTYPVKEEVIESFDGYFKRKNVPVKFSSGKLLTPDTKIRTDNYEKTQLIKQADVIMLLYLLSDKFSPLTKKINYDYYIKRTMHKSSLSPSIHAILASEVGDRVRAYHYFLFSLYSDIRNIYKNTNDGMHAACIGGVWQVVVNGFAGMRFVANILYFDPKLPAHWQRLEFNIIWREQRLRVSITGRQIEFYFKSDFKKDKIVISVCGDLQVIKANENCIFKRRDQTMKAKDIMSKKIVTLKDSLSVREIADVLIRKKLTGAPVVDQKGHLVGFLSERDMMKATRDIKKFPRKKARDIMTRKVYTVNPDSSAEKIVQVFNQRPYRFIPVTKKNSVVGVISRKDVIDRILGEYY